MLSLLNVTGYHFKTGPLWPVSRRIQRLTSQFHGMTPSSSTGDKFFPSLTIHYLPTMHPTVVSLYYMFALLVFVVFSSKPPYKSETSVWEATTLLVQHTIAFSSSCGLTNYTLRKPFHPHTQYLWLCANWVYDSIFIALKILQKHRSDLFNCLPCQLIHYNFIAASAFLMSSSVLCQYGESCIVLHRIQKEGRTGKVIFLPCIFGMACLKQPSKAVLLCRVLILDGQLRCW